MDKKPVYLCKNIEELQKKSEINKYVTSNIMKTCEALGKVYEQYEKSLLDKDEELAYIYVMRFLTMLCEVKKSFKNDAKYINAMFNSEKVNQAFERAEKLKNSLQARYEIDKQREIELKNESVKVVNNVVKEFVSVEEFYKCIKQDENVLIIDSRSESEFAACHISHARIVNIPADQLKPGFTIVEVNKLLEARKNDQELNIWKNRQQASSVVLVFWRKEDQEKANIVKDAIHKWDADRLVKHILVLESGLQSFSTHYPTMVTNSKYKGPEDLNHSDVIIPDNIHYPDWDSIDAEKKRKKTVKKFEERTGNDEMSGNDLEKRFNQIKSNTTNVPIDRSLKPGQLKEPLNELKPSLVVDRSLKPTSKREENQNESIPPETTAISIKKDTNTSEINLNKDQPNISLDRSLKPVLKEKNIDDVKSNISVHKDIENTENTSFINTPSENTRLSNNSRTIQDRTNFAAKGGAKSIPPPTDVVESKLSDLPPWVAEIFDKNTNEYYYIDRRTNKTHRILNKELLESSKENSLHKDYVESLKDHSNMSKPILKPPSGTSLKRSTSQPNLSEDLNSQNKPQTDNVDSTQATSRSRKTDPPTLNRQSKPSSFNEFSAARLHNFSPTYRTVNPGLTGLRNMGNTCYLNSVVQALSNTKFLTQYITSNNYQQDINRNNPLGYGGEIVSEFAQLITALWCGKYKEVSPTDFKRIIDCKNEMFRGGEQHDSQEFLLFLLDGLHEDLNRGSKLSKGVISSTENHQNDNERAQEGWKAHIAVNDSAIVRVFQGQYRSRVTCDFCQMSSVTFDAFMYLSLPLKQNQNRCTLEDCLKLFLAEEKMTGASQWFCPKCKVNRDAKKKIDIWKLPPYLLIHLKRFSCTGQYRQKLNTFVDFPTESLSLVDILQHTKQPQIHSTYHLYAVSNHHGNMESGHYTSFCKTRKGNEWYNFDDDIVTKIRESDVKTPSAYILFYESYNIKLMETKVK